MLPLLLRIAETIGCQSTQEPNLTLFFILITASSILSNKIHVISLIKNVNSIYPIRH